MNGSAALLETARGVLAGLLVSVPPGPMSALCLSRSARHGFGAGFTLAFGAAAGDAAYAGLALFGLAFLPDSVGIVPCIAAFVAAPVLLWMGVKHFARARHTATASQRGLDVDASSGPVPRAIPAATTGFVMSLGTPGTFPAFVALFAASSAGAAASGDPAASAAATVGVLVGALLWWAVVALLACRYRLHVTRHLATIDAVGGALLVFAAAVAAGFAISNAARIFG